MLKQTQILCILFFIFMFISSCSLIKKNNCDCPDFTKDSKQIKLDKIHI